MSQAIYYLSAAYVGFAIILLVQRAYGAVSRKITRLAARSFADYGAMYYKDQKKIPTDFAQYGAYLKGKTRIRFTAEESLRELLGSMSESIMSDRKIDEKEIVFLSEFISANYIIDKRKTISALANLNKLHPDAHKVSIEFKFYISDNKFEKNILNDSIVGASFGSVSKLTRQIMWYTFVRYRMVKYFEELRRETDPIFSHPQMGPDWDASRVKVSQDL